MIEKVKKMIKFDKQVLGRGAIYIFIENIAAMSLGYIFWITLSKLSNTEMVGTMSALVTFSGITAVVATIGISEGNQRFLGKSLSENKLVDAKVYVKASLLLVSIGIISCSIIVIIAKDWIHEVFEIDFSLIIIAIVLMGGSAIYMLFYSIITASFKTRVLPIIIVISSVIKLLLAFSLLLNGNGLLGLAIGFTAGQILASLLLGMVTLMIFKPFHHMNNIMPAISFVSAYKSILIASVASWIPILIMKVGSELGTIIIFGYQGSNQAAIYFISFAIVTGMMAPMSSLFAISLPALSSIDDGRKRFAWKTIRLSAIITLPLSSSLIFYSKEIMHLIGTNYIEGSIPLQILLLSMLPAAVVGGVTTLVYSYGYYRQFLAIGLAISIPRTILYFVIVPLYGIMGAALSYTIGSFIGLIISIIIANRVGISLLWKDLIFITIVPAGIAFILHYFQVHYIIAIFATNIISYLVLLKLRIISPFDLAELTTVLPHRISFVILNVSKKLSQKLKRFLS
jgi:O-antigen/teichoic acid export membrane protein